MKSFIDDFFPRGSIAGSPDLAAASVFEVNVDSSNVEMIVEDFYAPCCDIVFVIGDTVVVKSSFDCCVMSNDLFPGGAVETPDF